MTQEENLKSLEGKKALQRIEDRKASMLQEISKEAGKEVAAEARILLDYIETVLATDLPEGEGNYVNEAISRSIPFIQEARDPVEKHLRLIAAAHILVNVLRSEVESKGDEYAAIQFEDLLSKLTNLEGVELTNPSIDSRLASTFEGLLELASVFGLTQVNYLDIRY